MTKSIFDRIYSYRELINKNSRENYLIEVFAYCLETDFEFFSDFLKCFGIKNDIEFTISTQVVYSLGRPDIEIYLKNSKTAILIECKIDHIERENQLNDYKKILLKKNAKNKYLIYLTKYYENKQVVSSELKFHQIKWEVIYSLISESNNQITIELKNYLKEQNMSESNNFQYQDLVILKSVTSTIAKMDEVLDGIKNVFEEKIGKFSRDASRSTRLSEMRYINYHDVMKEKIQQYSIEAGFYWWDDEIEIGIRVYIPKKDKNINTKVINSIFKQHLKTWYFEDWGTSYNYWLVDPVAKFIINEDEQIPKMINFLCSGINEIETLVSR